MKNKGESLNYVKIPGFGLGKSNHKRENVEEMLYYMILRQYLIELVCDKKKYLH